MDPTLFRPGAVSDANAYVFVNSSPENFADPSGRFAILELGLAASIQNIVSAAYAGAGQGVFIAARAVARNETVLHAELTLIASTAVGVLLGAAYFKALDVFNNLIDSAITSLVADSPAVESELATVADAMDAAESGGDADVHYMSGEADGASAGENSGAAGAAVEGVEAPQVFKKSHALRGNYDAKMVMQIATDMKQNGWHGDPIEVVKSPDGKLVIANGHHRVYAAKLAGIRVPYKVVTHTASK